MWFESAPGNCRGELPCREHVSSCPGWFSWRLLAASARNPWLQSEASGATVTELSAAPPVLATERPAAQLSLIALKGEAIYAATDYWIESGRLLYVLRSGTEGALDLNEVDWDRTAQLNAERGITVTLRDRPRAH